jgi:hypothetical protein
MFLLMSIINHKCSRLLICLVLESDQKFYRMTKKAESRRIRVKYAKLTLSTKLEILLRDTDATFAKMPFVVIVHL